MPFGGRNALVVGRFVGVVGFLVQEGVSEGLTSKKGNSKQQCCSQNTGRHATYEKGMGSGWAMLHKSEDAGGG